MYKEILTVYSTLYIPNYYCRGHLLNLTYLYIRCVTVVLDAMTIRITVLGSEMCYSSHLSGGQKRSSWLCIGSRSARRPWKRSVGICHLFSSAGTWHWLKLFVAIPQTRKERQKQSEMYARLKPLDLPKPGTAPSKVCEYTCTLSLLCCAYTFWKDVDVLTTFCQQVSSENSAKRKNKVAMETRASIANFEATHQLLSLPTASIDT